MNRIEVISKVGSDGVLRLTVPLPESDAGREVRVTVELVPKPPMTQEEWRAVVMKTAGSWQGDIDRPKHGEEEEPVLSKGCVADRGQPRFARPASR